MSSLASTIPLNKTNYWDHNIGLLTAVSIAKLEVAIQRWLLKRDIDTEKRLCGLASKAILVAPLLSLFIDQVLKLVLACFLSNAAYEIILKCKIQMFQNLEVKPTGAKSYKSIDLSTTILG